MRKPVLYQVPLVDQVYKDIKEKIVTGEIGPNTKLITRALCEHYGISDTPLKQALNRLVSEGLVDAEPRRGMRVKQMTPKDIHESIEARLMIELYAVDAALKAVREKKSLLKDLAESIKKDEALIKEAKDLGTYSELAQRELEVSQQFHTIIIATTGNDLILNTYKNIVNHTYYYYQSGLNKTAQAISSIKEHKLILRKLETQDENGLRRAVREHLRTRESAVASAFES